MTKKEIANLADLINRGTVVGAPIAVEHRADYLKGAADQQAEIVERIAAELARRLPRFNRERFLSLCGR